MQDELTDHFNALVEVLDVDGVGGHLGSGLRIIDGLLVVGIELHGGVNVS